MTKLTQPQLMVLRYLRSRGFQQEEIAQHLKVSRQVVAYQLNKLRGASIDKGALPGLKQVGGISPLVGYVSAPCLPPRECDWCDLMAMDEQPEGDHSCPLYVEFAAYAQMEDLPKHQKIAVLLSLLQGVELE